ncbi:hypothetical protein [Maridesulfovibrio sp. FT414]|uniref:hypothetical protein n=1 Tax=Maridesulfovibrio sp. FT414 TaxID=2979469 RepID=UPI003D808194
MSNCKRFCHTHILDSFAARIQILSETVHSKSPTGTNLLSTINTLFVIKSLSKIVIMNFSTDWQDAACDINRDGDCERVLDKAVRLRDQLVETHMTLCTLASPFARWAGRRLTGPVLDWNDLVLDLSIASDPHIQSSLSQLEEVL